MEMAKPLLFHQFPNEVGNHFRPYRGLKLGFLTLTGWWFQLCSLFTPTWGNDPN